MGSGYKNLIAWLADYILIYGIGLVILVSRNSSYFMKLLRLVCWIAAGGMELLTLLLEIEMLLWRI